ncbi:hypothetical protein EDD18DRAFT_1353652 [Armillaria luteobubalina]|uniref:Uncharacterized protein n=1 Tax=Armillaria luteobubalina TaxID=153913 RepID=A0AA39UWP2_9AGAR|nr:hypothetical protein EDD18DRAFT_1353652 [Armillaria luteobubalina]
MPPSSTAHTRTPQELLGAITPSLAHLAAMSLPAAPAVSNTVPASQLFPSSDLPPSSTPQLPYPLVASLTVSAALARLGQMTALQSNPAALVAQMVSTQSRPQPPVPSFFPALCVVATQTETSLIQAGLNPPPPFPLYSGLSTPEILQEDIGPMDRQFERIGLVINMIIHDGLLSFSDIHRAIAQHQALPKSPKIPSFNSDPDASYLMSGWCLQQMRCVRNHTSLRCCKKAYKTGTYWCLQMLTAYASMVKAPVDTGGHSDPTLKHIFIIGAPHDDLQHMVILFTALRNAMWMTSELPLTRPKHASLIPALRQRKNDIFGSVTVKTPTSIHRGVVAKRRTTMKIYMVVDNDNDKENQSPGMAQPIHHLSQCTFHILPLPSVHPDGTTLLRIHAKDVQEAADVFWHVLLHIRSIMPKLPPGEVIDPSHHSEPVLLPQTLVMNWWQLEVFLDGTIIQQGQGVGQSIYVSVLAINLMRIIDTTNPNCQFSRLPNDSLLVSLRFPIPDLTSDQAGFWWAVGFLLALFSTATGQACLPVQGMLIHVLLLHALGQCHYQIDHWTPSFIYSTDPAMGELMLPWLDLGKTQAMTADPDGKDRLKEPIPQFLMAYCSNILSMMGFRPRHAAVHENHNQAICAYLMLGNAVFDVLAAYHALHAGFHQPFSIEFGSLTRGPTLPSMIKDACECKNKTALEFIYWWFNNRLEHVEQLIPHLEYDIGPIINTPQNNLSFARGEAETLAHRVSRAFQNALEEYLRVDIKERGKQLLLAMTASPYLPTNPDKKLKFQFRLLNNDVQMDVPTTKSLWSFVHGCFQTIDIGYDGVLASLLVNGLWRGITIDSYFQGIFMGDVTCFNME